MDEKAGGDTESVVEWVKEKQPSIIKLLLDLLLLGTKTKAGSNSQERG